MPEITILTEKELRDCIRLDRQALNIVADAFTALAEGRVVMPPILRLDIEDHNGEIDVKTAYMRGLDSFAIKMSPGFFDNPKLGLPSVTGLMTLFSARTGLLQSVLLDNGFLTDVRTAAAGGVAAEHLAREDAETAGIIGSGVQGRLQLQALTLVRDIKKALVWSRNTEKTEVYARDLSAELGLAVEAVGSAETVVRQADVVVTTTPSRTPVVQAEWLHPGLHITAMGSDAEHKNELHPQILAQADVFACDARSQSIRLGELHHAVAGGTVPEDMAVVELGAVISGAQAGRRRPEDVTVCDLTGTGVQDTAIARHAYQKALERGYGVLIQS